MMLSRFDPKVMESMVRDYYSKVNLKVLINDRLKDKPKVGYVEGPPTMNGEPHIGHIRGRVMKDLWYRFNTLKSINIIFRAGWDTQGLPVELQAEKELGLTGSKLENLKIIGMERLVDECKRLVHRYNAKWIEVDSLLGMSMDYENAYWTYKDEYIEREWKYLKRAYEQGILVEGYRVVAYCPSCQTSLSHAEVSQGYESVEDPSLYYKVRLIDDENTDCNKTTYIIVWTTMPFTLVTDELVGVNPEADYVYVNVNFNGKEEVWVLAYDRLSILAQEFKINSYSIVKRVKGYMLEGKRYEHPLIDLIPGLKAISSKVHFVVAEQFVDINTGSGIVHLSPANGEEDFEVASRRSLPIFNPIDDNAVFTQDTGIFAGLFVRDADDKVVELLANRNALVKIGKIKHEYPLCWRSHHKVVWLARREYFYLIDKIADKALSAASNVEYFYQEPRNRFLAIISERKPWCISRERIWGTPLPIWVCSNPSCRSKIPLFSRQEIINNAIELPDGKDFELHRPWIDRVVVRCSKCNSKAYREPFVLDTWHNSGAAPYASMSDEEYEKLVPVPFLTEGIDQTRGWAYTLLMENVIMKGEAPFKAFLFQGHVVDEHGNKMSKSLGNVVDAHDLLKSNSVDMVRFYLMWKASPIDSLSFSIDEMKRRVYQVLNTLYNLHVYFIQNAGYDGFNAQEHTLEWAISNNLLRESELWLLSTLQRVIERVTYGYEHCRFHESARVLEDFIINDLSQRYVPFTRYELWDDSKDTLNRRLAIYATLAYSLLTVDILLHPICPYITEYLYITCFKHKASIMLEDWVKPNKGLVNESLEKVFELMDSIISLSNSARMKASLKRRWPLAAAYVCLSSREDVELINNNSSLLNTLKAQMNVDRVHIKYVNIDNIDDKKDNNIILSKCKRILALIDQGLPLRANIVFNVKSIAKKVKGDIPLVLEHLNRIDSLSLLRELYTNGMFTLSYNDKSVIISIDDVSDVKYEAIEGYVLSSDDSMLVMLSTFRDSRLIAKGLVRDIARRLQALRKEKGYNPTDVVEHAYIAGLDDDAIDILNQMKNELAYLVRARDVNILSMNEAEEVSKSKGIKFVEVDIDGKQVMLYI